MTTIRDVLLERTSVRFFPRFFPRQSFTDAPSTVEPRRTLRPRFAGQPDSRIGALLRYKDFLATYADARLRWIAGRSVHFPAGTYWLARNAQITITPLASPAPTFG